MSFTSIPPMPQGGSFNDMEVRFLTAIKQNVELLTGQRDSASGSAAVLKSATDIDKLPAMTLQDISANGSGVVISGSAVPLLTDYDKLLLNFISLANDVSTLYAKVNALIEKLGE